MTTFPFSTPSAHEPEVVHVAFRRAKFAWSKEQEAVLMLAARGPASAATTKYLEEAVSFAEDETADAVTLYIIAIREAHPALREAQHSVA